MLGAQGDDAPRLAKLLVELLLPCCPGVQAILDSITEQYARGRVAIMSEDEMAELVAQHIPALADRAKALLS